MITTSFVFSSPRSRRQHYGWLAALSAAVVIHVAAVVLALWHPEQQQNTAPAAAPLVFDISMVAAPVAPANDLPVDELQQQSSATPQQQAQPETVQKTAPQANSNEAMSTTSDVILKQTNLQQTDAETVEVSPQEKAAELEQPDEPVEKTQEDTQMAAQTNSGEGSNEQQSDQTSAPLTLETQQAEQASAPSVGAFSEQQSEAEADWQSLLQAHLERRKRYPREAQLRRHQGAPWVSFSMDRDGNVLDVQLYRSSGYPSLDREAIALIRRAEPLPAPPEHISKEQLSIALPIQFYMQ